ncbi:hypothetical protein [Sorangium sp. So ce204]|uniref:hypothetical protein n=1 Tax=Sorangium sp. So ce204 TaxID=3133288 RepID=UPI003F5EFC06
MSNTDRPLLDHENLDAYRVAIEFLALSVQLLEEIPKAEQGRRARQAPYVTPRRHADKDVPIATCLAHAHAHAHDHDHDHAHDHDHDHAHDHAFVWCDRLPLSLVGRGTYATLGATQGLLSR